MPEYKDVISKQLETLSYSSVSRTHINSSKIVVVNKPNSINVFGIGLHDQNNGNDQNFLMESDIIDTILLENKLWIVLSNGKVMLINIEDNTRANVEIVNFSSYNIQRVSMDMQYLYFTTLSEEILAVSHEEVYNNVDLPNDLQLTAVKLKGNPAAYAFNIVSQNGMNLFLEDGILTAECLLTGLKSRVPASNNNIFKHLCQWDNLTILADEKNMWLFDLHKNKVEMLFHHEGDTYYPLGESQNKFYYILFNDKDAEIHSVCKPSLHPTEDGDTMQGAAVKAHPQEMLKSQVRTLLLDMSSSDANPKEILQKLSSLYLQIDDYNFLIDNASKCYQFNDQFKMLLYIVQKRISVCENDNIAKKLYDIMYKIDLKEYICFRGLENYKDNNLFELDFVELCLLFIKRSDFDLASICWMKHFTIRDSLTTEQITNLLEAIPQNTKLSAMVVWLKNFVPSLLDENPYCVDIFVRWTTERVCNLEKSSYWPKIGIKFIDEVMFILQSSMKTIPLRPISLDDLDVLKDRIIQITELKDNFKINMLLGELGSHNPSEIAMVMLHRCYTEDLSKFLKEYLPIFTSRHLFELDDILKLYIENDANSGGGCMDGMRLGILLDAFRLTSTKLECLLTVLKILDVPWNDEINKIAVTAAAQTNYDFTSNDSDQVLAQKILEEIKFAKLKIIMKKYNLPSNCTDHLLLINKMTNASVVDIDDIKVVIEVASIYKHYASIQYIDRCLKDCNTRQALDYYSNLSKPDRKVIIKSLLAKYEHSVKNITQQKSYERCYIDFFKGTESLDQMLITNIENMNYLKNSYEVCLSMNDIFSERPRNETLKKISLKNKSRVSWFAGTHLSDDIILISQLQKVSTTTHVRSFAEQVLLLVHGKNVCDEDIASILVTFFNDDSNLPFLSEACHVFVQLLSNCKEEFMYNLTRILYIINGLVNSNIVIRNLASTWKFHYIHIPVTAIVSDVDAIKLFKSNVTDTNYSDLLNIANMADFTPIRLISNLAIQSYNDESFVTIKERIVKKQIAKIGISNELDELYITCLLLMLNVAISTESNPDHTMLELLRGQSDSITPVLTTYLSLGLVRRIFDLHTLPGNKASFSPHQLLKSKYNITPSDIALQDNTEETSDVKNILFNIIKQQSPSIELLKDFCRTLNIAIDDGLSLMLVAMLTKWNLEYKLLEDDLCRQHLKTSSDEQKLIKDSAVIFKSIKDKTFIKDILTDFWKNGEVSLHGRLISINSYFYEVYLCIYSLLFGATSDSKINRNFFLLNFLKDYRRKSSPQQYEFESFSLKGVFPEIGYYRLPFHLFMRDDMWLNLKCEITLETYEKWLPAVALLSLDNDLQIAKDMICSNALKQTMKSRKADSIELEGKETEPWRLTSKEEPLLRAAHRCVTHIANMEWAGACLFYVLQGCSRGADQVAAAHLCYRFSKGWDDVQPGNRAVRKMERLYSTLSTRHALHKIEWAIEDLVQLLTEPTQLIQAMYLHPQFMEKMARYDINSAINDIADKNGINISLIRIQILESLLEKSSSNDRDNVPLNNKELMIAKFILKATCPKMGAIYLSRIAFDDESNYNKNKKLRALQCLMSVVDHDTARKVTPQQCYSLWTALLQLYYIINFENYEMPWAVVPFVQDKTSSLDQILCGIGNNADRLKLVAELVYRYGRTQTVFHLVKLLLSRGLYEEIIPLLQKVLSPPNDMLRAAWQAVLLTPFKTADYPMTDRQKVKCLRAINLLPLCPLVRDEDLKEIWKYCLNCKSFGLACLVLPYMTPETRISLSELKRIDRRNLIASLKNLHADTFLVTGAMHVIENMPKSATR